MYATTAGEAPLKELNEGYFTALKEYPVSTVYTGFRMWKKNSKKDYQKSADAGGVVYTLQDWSSYIKEPEPMQEKTNMDTKKNMGTMSEEEKMMMQAEKDMIFLVIVVVLIATILIMAVIIVVCRLRTRNTKTPIQLHEGGELEMKPATNL